MKCHLCDGFKGRYFGYCSLGNIKKFEANICGVFTQVKTLVVVHTQITFSNKIFSVLKWIAFLTCTYQYFIQDKESPLFNLKIYACHRLNLQVDVVGLAY